MVRVELRIPSAQDISSIMGASREWLSEQGIDAFLYCSCEPGGLACSIHFRRADEAAVFAAAFRDSLVSRKH